MGRQNRLRKRARALPTSHATGSASSMVLRPRPAQQKSSYPPVNPLSPCVPARLTDDIETPEAFYTATPGYAANFETPGRLDISTRYGGVLREQNLLVAKEVESNWSGRGQHVEFKTNEDIPLVVEKTIGHSATALVESVRCRRIRLARKSIRCTRRAKLEDLVQEVSYLHRLHHPHIVQMVGTYLQKNIFAVLLYPVATGDLARFLEDWQPEYFVLSTLDSPVIHTQRDLARFFFCLTHALQYMHDQGIRHMDIKPSNILVHERRSIGRPTVRSVYLTDFGISKAFTEEAGSQMEGPSSMTKMWCSPEVAAQKSRGRAADIFSLGCVFVEMYTVLVRKSSADFEDFRAQDGNGAAFHLTLPRVLQWMLELQDKVESESRAATEKRIDLSRLFLDPPRDMMVVDQERRSTSAEVPSSLFLDLLRNMMAEDPERRPTSAEVATRLESMKIHGTAGHTYTWKDYQWKCCSASRESYRVAEEDEIYDRFKFTETQRGKAEFVPPGEDAFDSMVRAAEDSGGSLSRRH